jgi:hypothetical protein
MNNRQMVLQKRLSSRTDRSPDYPVNGACGRHFFGKGLFAITQGSRAVWPGVGVAGTRGVNGDVVTGDYAQGIVVDAAFSRNPKPPVLAGRVFTDQYPGNFSIDGYLGNGFSDPLEMIRMLGQFCYSPFFEADVIFQCVEMKQVFDCAVWLKQP